MKIDRYQCGKRMSEAVACGGLIYLSALAAPEQTHSVITQTQNILEKLDRILLEAGTSKSKLIQASVWLADIGDYAAMNSVWDSWVAPGAAPARTCSETRFSVPDILVEISGIAAL
jgi:enamine deaminase RidA (YjgF/YER057c/UK114 family)